MATHTPGTGEHNENVKHELKVFQWFNRNYGIYQRAYKQTSHGQGGQCCRSQNSQMYLPSIVAMFYVI